MEVDDQTSRSEPDLNDPAIVEIALMLARAATDRDYRNVSLIEELSFALALRIAGATLGKDVRPEDGFVAKPDERIERVLGHIARNIAESELSVEELASVANVTPHHLSRLFKSALRQTPHQFVIAQRIALAKLMIMQGDKTLSEITYLCGFANQAHFTTRFRDRTGETPNRFKERIATEGHETANPVRKQNSGVA